MGGVFQLMDYDGKNGEMDEERILKTSGEQWYEDCLKLLHSDIADFANVRVIKDISANDFDGISSFEERESICRTADDSTVIHDEGASVLDDIEPGGGPSSEVLEDGSCPVNGEVTTETVLRTKL